jgi:hypothetical protein
MDSAFARVDGPIHNFEESLVAFARANYALRLENGRCAVEAPAACGGRYYDPKGMYATPPLEAELDYTGASLTYDGTIPSSFGMDFIEVSLELGGQDHPLTLRFQGAGPVTHLDVQIWKLSSTPGKPAAITPQPEIVPQQADGAHITVIPHVDTPAYDRLALIITRLDADEGTDQEGAYRIALEPTDGFLDTMDFEPTLHPNVPASIPNESFLIN